MDELLPIYLYNEFIISYAMLSEVVGDYTCMLSRFAIFSAVCYLTSATINHFHSLSLIHLTISLPSLSCSRPLLCLFYYHFTYYVPSIYFSFMNKQLTLHPKLNWQEQWFSFTKAEICWKRNFKVITPLMSLSD